MKYYIDTEFHEGFHKPTFGKRRHFIDLISIGIVCEDGRTYYAISKDFYIKAAWNSYDLNYGSGDQRNLTPRKVYWLRENVLKSIFKEWIKEDSHWTNKDLTLGNWDFTYKNFKYFLKKNGKSNKQIAEEIVSFVNPPSTKGLLDYIKVHNINTNYPREKNFGSVQPEFYGYYADYDWVLFCSLFGRMIDIPNGFPMYCRDLKQMLDEYVTMWRDNRIKNETQKIDFGSWEEYLRSVKNNPDYPKQTNEHNALADARWNKKLYEFLQSL